MKFSQETYIATAEYDAQFEYTPDTEEEDGSCRSYMTYILTLSPNAVGEKERCCSEIFGVLRRLLS